MAIGEAEGVAMSGPRWLVVRFRAIGDCVMAAWPVTAIRQAHPDAWIVWAVESRCAPVISSPALANEIAEFPRDHWKKHRWSPRTWHCQLHCYAALRKHRFDFGIDLQGHSKTALALRLSGARRRIAVDATDALAARLNPVAALAEGHTVDRHMRALNELGKYGTPRQPIMPEAPVPPDWPAGPVVSLMTGASSPRKSYPVEQWEAVASNLRAQGLSVVAIGGPHDPPLTSVDRNYVGKLCLRGSLGAVAASAVHVCADTGTGHAAAAYGVPVVSLFGRGKHTPERFRPYSDRATVLQQGDLPCSITPEQVSEAALRFL